MAYKTILYEKEDRLGLVTLNRPERLNALSRELVAEVMTLLDDVERDDQVRAIIITGAPRPDGRPCFSAGADLKERAARPELQRTAYDTVRAMMDRGPDKGLRGLCDRLETMARISIAAVDGICTAGGMELALSCDMRVASETAQMSDMHIKNLGSIGGAGVSTRLARLIGPPKAKELMFTGEPVGGQEACRIGLVNQVFPPDKLIEGAKTLGRKVAAMRPEALALAKAAMNAAMDMDIERALRFSYICQAIKPSTEGYKAFVEKRKPEF